MNILSKINSMAVSNPKELIKIAENRYDAELNAVVNRVVENENHKIILLAGPSGSGKTTTAHIIKNKLTLKGKKVEVISLDHFFLPMDKMPLQDNGEKDFESVYSLDISAIHHCFNELISKLVRDEQSSNIFDILVTFEVLNELKSKLVKTEQP